MNVFWKLPISRAGRSLSLLLCSTVLVTSPVLAIRPPESAGRNRARHEDPPARQRTAGQRAQSARAEDESLSVKWHSRRAIPVSVRGKRLGRPGAFHSGKGLTAGGQGRFVDDAVAVMDSLAGLYRLKDVQQEFRARSVRKDRLGHTHVSLEQVYGGLRVIGGAVSVHFDGASEAYEANGRYVQDLDVGIVPALTADEAETRARENLALRTPIKGQLEGDPELLIYALGEDSRLAYHLTLSTLDPKSGPERREYYVDALNGEILLAFDSIAHIAAPTANGNHTTISGSILAGEGGGSVSVSGWHENAGAYYLYNKTNYWYVYNAASSGYSDNNTYAYRASVSWGTSDRVEMSAARNFAIIQTYFRTVHGLNSFDNAGAYARANMHVGSSYVNAYWDGSTFNFGDGDGSTANPLGVLDVSAHEYAHAVTDYSADLYYYGESGALNESFSDIFGANVEFFAQPDGTAAYPNVTAGQSDWLVGEDSWISSKALRDMRNPANPATVGSGNLQPTRYKGTYWYYGTGDNGGVHYNSGVQNFFYYLLCQGGTGINDGIAYSFAGIGRTNAEQVAYRALTVHAGPYSEHEDIRSAWISAATDLNTNWIENVDAAWEAVGVVAGLAAVAPPAFAPPEGTYSSSISVTVETATAEASIYYTLNGSEPSQSSTLYSSPLVVTSATTIKAKAFKDGLLPSETISASYSFLGTRIYSFPLDTSPGWTTSGLWAFGQPTGAGGQHGDPDPTAGYTGANVYGYNLSGDYEDFLSPTRWLTSQAMDLSDVSDAKLTFRRWLGVERPAYDHAYIQVSNDGSQWSTVWENSAEITDTDWTYQTVDISSVADRQGAVRVRWGMGSTDESWVYCGWNLDDIEIWGSPGGTNVPAAPGSFQASAVSSNEVGLTWVDAADNEQGFAIERKLSGGSWSEIVRVGANVQLYSDTSVVSGSTYVYRIRAYNGSGYSAYATESSVTVPSGTGDGWDPVDDAGPDGSLLPSPTGIEQTHGPHSLSDSDLYDWFSVFLYDGVEYNFNTAGGSGDTYGELYADTGGAIRIAYDDDSAGGLQFSLTYQPSVSAWYFLRVRTWSAGQSAAYTLKYSADTAPDETPDGWDPGDDVGAGASALPGPTTSEQTHGPHRLSTVDHYDWFSVFLYDSVEYNFNTAGSEGDMYAELYADTGGVTQLAFDDDSAGGLQFSLTYQATTSAWHYLRVRTWSVGQIVAYTLKYSADANPPPSLPSTPTNLLATGFSSNQVNLVWTDTSTNEQGFAIERKPSGGSWQEIILVGADVEAWSDTNVAPATAYIYRLRAYNAGGYSDYTAESSVTTPSGIRDEWDPGDDTGSGAIQLNDPVLGEQTHGPHSLSDSDLYDWFSVLLYEGVEYNFNTAGGSGNTYGELYSDTGGVTQLAVDDDSGGDLQFSLTYQATTSAWHFLRVRCASVGQVVGYTLNYSDDSIPVPVPVPIHVEVEDYNAGGEGIGYHDTTAGNAGVVYRSEDVDIAANASASNGYVVGWVRATEWLEYTVSVDVGGTFAVEVRASCNGVGGTFHVEVDGTNVTGTMQVPDTGGWNSFQTVAVPGVALSAGTHVLRLYGDSGNMTGWVGNLDQIRIVPYAAPAQDPYGGVAHALPGAVECENYDEGGALAYSDTTPGNAGGVYRADDVDLAADGNASNGYVVAWTRTDEWLEYTVDVASNGNYTIQVRLACGLGGGTYHVEVGGVDKTGPLAVPSTGSWGTYQVMEIENVALTAGEQILRLEMDGGNASGWVANFDQIRVTPYAVSGGQGGYGGTHAVPGSIECEDYDTGGTAIAYSDTTPGNAGGVYRSEDVDIAAVGSASNGYVVGWTKAGEWLEYTINVGVSGQYRIEVGVACNLAGGTFHFEVDSSPIGSTQTMPNTGSWGTYQEVEMGGISLTAGTKVLRLYMDGGNAAGWVGNFDQIRILPEIPQTPYTPTSLPGTIECENYDTDGAGVAYSDTTIGNAGVVYRSDNVDISADAGAGNGYLVGWTRTGEWLEYTVSAAGSGTYNMAVRVACNGIGGTFHVEVDGIQVGTTKTVPNTGGWSTYQNVPITGISISTGSHVIRLEMDSGNANGWAGNFDRMVVTDVVSVVPVEEKKSIQDATGPVVDQVLTSDDVAGEESPGWLAVDGDEETAWPGRAGAGGWWILLGYSREVTTDGIELQLEDGSLTDVRMLGSRDSEEWYDISDLFEADLPAAFNYLWLVFADDESGAVPQVTEILIDQ